MNILKNILPKVKRKTALLLCGGVIGLAAGVLITVLCAQVIISEEREKFLVDKGQLSEQNEILEDELKRTTFL